MTQQLIDHLIDWFSKPCASVSDDERESVLQILRPSSDDPNDVFGPLAKFANDCPSVAAEIRKAVFDKGISFIEAETGRYAQIKRTRALTPDEKSYGQTLQQLLESTVRLMVPDERKPSSGATQDG